MTDGNGKLEVLKRHLPLREEYVAAGKIHHARHSSVTWQLMLGKNLLWAAKQHGYSLEVMLRMYAAWLDNATAADIQAIKQALKKGPAVRASNAGSNAAISAVNTATNRAIQIVIRPLTNPRNLAVGKDLSDSSLRNDLKIKWRCCQSSAKSSLAPKSTNREKNREIRAL